MNTRSTSTTSTSTKEFDAQVWTGRNDGDSPEHRRWHQGIRDARSGVGERAEVALIGFASEEGVRRNGGRPGAADGPDALRRALAPLALHTDATLVDAGTVVVDGEDLESAHDLLGDRIAELYDARLTDDGLVVVLGGGHETAWGSYLGRIRTARFEEMRVGVLNLDAHFDLRDAEQATSGTPFRQMADADAEAARDFDYTVLGIAEPSNTGALFDRADALGVSYVLDVDCTTRHLDDVIDVVDDLLARVDAVHLSIDLDVLPAATAPGVSAPAAYGVPVEVIEAVCRQVAVSGKLALLDVVELCPRLDVDSRTARTAARLITTSVHARP